MAAERRTSPTSRLPRVSLLAAALALMAGAVQAQSLQELYDAARAYDATYLAARATADSAQYRSMRIRFRPILYRGTTAPIPANHQADSESAALRFAE